MSDGPELFAAKYIELTRSYLSGALTPLEFTRRYMREVKDDPRRFPREHSEVINDLFMICDSYVDDPLLRDSVDDLDELQLKMQTAAELELLEKLPY